MESSPTRKAIEPARIRAWEIVVWLIALAMWFVAPKYAPLLNEVAVFALFAVSLALNLGYRHLLPLGHASSFCTDPHVASLVTNHLIHDPILGLFANVPVRRLH